MRSMSLTAVTALAAVAGAAFLATPTWAAGLRTPFAKSGGQSVNERLDQEEAQDPRLQPFRVRSFVFRPGFVQPDEDELEPLVPVPTNEGQGTATRRVERRAPAQGGVERCTDCDKPMQPQLPPHMRGR